MGNIEDLLTKSIRLVANLSIEESYAYDKLSTLQDKV
jgi:hypothetical protein